MPKPIITKQAQSDIREIYRYVGEFDIDAADRWYDELRQKSKTFASNPRSGRDRSDLATGLRSFVVRKYVVLFRSEGDTIRILRVLHGSRDIDSLISDED